MMCRYSQDRHNSHCNQLKTIKNNVTSKRKVSPKCAGLVEKNTRLGQQARNFQKR